MADLPSQRLDKWLWVARFAKTREIGAAMAEKGKVRLNGVKTDRAHKPVRLGDVLTIPFGPGISVVRVIGFSEKRVGAKLVATLCERVEDTLPDSD